MVGLDSCSYYFQTIVHFKSKGVYEIIRNSYDFRTNLRRIHAPRTNPTVGVGQWREPPEHPSIISQSWRVETSTSPLARAPPPPTGRPRRPIRGQARADGRDAVARRWRPPRSPLLIARPPSGEQRRRHCQFATQLRRRPLLAEKQAAQRRQR